MHPLFLDEINAQLIEDRIRAARKAARSRSFTPSAPRHLRSALGIRLVRLGMRLVITDPRKPTLASVNSHRH